MSSTVTYRGPLFTSVARREFDSYCRDARQNIAETGVSMIRQRLNQVLKHQTGHYVSSVRVERKDDRHEITDGGIVYGPWLEGVSERNRSTRFKGYRTFRETTQLIQMRAPEIAQRVLVRHIGRIG